MTVTSVATFILTLAVWLGTNLLWYRDGKRHGASDVIHQLFAGKSDFYRYQIYRMTGGRDAWMLYVNACRLAYGQRKNGSKGFVRLDEPMGYEYRKYGAAELLYSMTRAGIRRGR